MLKELEHWRVRLEHAESKFPCRVCGALTRWLYLPVEMWCCSPECSWRLQDLYDLPGRKLLEPRKWLDLRPLRGNEIMKKQMEWLTKNRAFISMYVGQGYSECAVFYLFTRNLKRPPDKWLREQLLGPGMQPMNFQDWLVLQQEAGLSWSKIMRRAAWCATIAYEEGINPSRTCYSGAAFAALYKSDKECEKMRLWWPTFEKERYDKAVEWEMNYAEEVRQQNEAAKLAKLPPAPEPESDPDLDGVRYLIPPPREYRGRRRND